MTWMLTIGDDTPHDDPILKALGFRLSRHGTWYRFVASTNRDKPPPLPNPLRQTLLNQKLSHAWRPMRRRQQTSKETIPS